MFADHFTLKLGDVTVKGRRLTLKELKSSVADLTGGRLDVEKCVELISSHVTLEDGDKFDPYDLTPGQLRQIVSELVLPKEGRGISDFIGLLS
jgi:hypothetical protein